MDTDREEDFIFEYCNRSETIDLTEESNVSTSNTESNEAISRCPVCNQHQPQYVLDCNRGRCVNCSSHIYCLHREVYDRNDEQGCPQSCLSKIKRTVCFVDECCDCTAPDNFCLLCRGKLVAIGHGRVNGADHADWDGRKYHKRCWSRWISENGEPI